MAIPKQTTPVPTRSRRATADRPRSSTTSGNAFFNERAQQGRPIGLVYLVHPGPSLLVTAVFVAVAGLATHAVPAPLRALQLAGTMLAAQFAIGTFNDVFDRRADADAKPYKPLVRGAVSLQAAVTLGSALAVVALILAATLNVATFVLIAIGLCAGLLYDVGLRRTPGSWLPWWFGFAALPLAAYAATSLFTTTLLFVLPLTLLIAFGLHCANAIPDIVADRAAGYRSVPVVLGESRARRAAMATLVAAAILATITALLTASRLTWPVVGGAALLIASVVAVALRAIQRPFPLLAVATGVLAVTWFAALPM